LKLQQTIWRINRSISRSSSVTEALGVIEEMKAAGIDSANEGTYLALITVCRRQQQGERALSIYEVSYSNETSRCEARNADIQHPHLMLPPSKASRGCFPN
jgi:serine/threonine-protein kinase RIO1